MVKSENSIQTLEDMLRACVIDLKRIWDKQLVLVEFSYNNSYYSTISMDPFEASYGRRCRFLIGLFKVCEYSLFGSELINKTLGKFHMINNRLETAYSRQSHMLTKGEQI